MRLIKINVISVAFLIALGFGARTGEGAEATEEPAPVLKLEADPARAVVTFLSWDTEGGGRGDRNLLRPGAGVALRLRRDGESKSIADLPEKKEIAPSGSGFACKLALSPEARLLWSVQAEKERIAFRVAAEGSGGRPAEGVEIIFPFDPRVTPTTVIPRVWHEDGTLELPAVIVAPDFGAMRVEARDDAAVKGRLLGSRAAKTVDFILEAPLPAEGNALAITLEPLRLRRPEEITSKELWRAARRGWLGAFQPSARWGDQSRPFSAPEGILANNAISDPASCSLWFYADQALWTPDLAPGVLVMGLVRRSIDWWLDRRTRLNGEVVCYWDYGNFLDANAGPLIAAWDYVEAEGDREWLARRIERLELIAEFLARRDVDGDGLVEAVQSGNRGTLVQPARSCAWWDALNCGHKDAYTNALIYRAWRCLADLEGKLGREAERGRWTALADKLKAAYRSALFNPKTGWLAWWRSADGELHDYAAPTVNGLAIEYGLVEPAEGREILNRLWKKFEAAGFKRFDLGLPSALVPVARADYLLPDSAGCPKQEDGADTFGQYMNGGISAGHALHFLAAHYVAGDGERADRILRAMLDRQAGGGFQNGVTDEAGKGIDWTTWDGKPCGYEGYLADSFRFLQAALLREAAARARLYRPLRPWRAGPGEPVSLFDGKSLSGWRPFEDLDDPGRYGKVGVEEGSMVLEAGGPMTGIAWSGDLPRDRYEIRLEGRRLEGGDFFCGLTFPVGDAYLTWILGGWGGSVVGLSNIDGRSAEENETTTVKSFEEKRWYKLRLQVTPARVEAWIDGERAFSLERPGHRFTIWWQQEPGRPLGLTAYRTKAELRGIELRRLP